MAEEKEEGGQVDRWDSKVLQPQWLTALDPSAACGNHRSLQVNH